MKSVRQCGFRYEPDLVSLIITRGSDAARLADLKRKHSILVVKIQRLVPEAKYAETHSVPLQSAGRWLKSQRRYSDDFRMSTNPRGNQFLETPQVSVVDT